MAARDKNRDEIRQTVFFNNNLYCYRILIIMTRSHAKNIELLALIPKKTTLSKSYNENV